ncbi:MAG: hypothetical protein ACXVZO_07830 [Gaiellaceae bacterium]
MTAPRGNATRYLAEVYTPRRELERLDEKTESIRAAAKALAREGVPIRHLQAVFVPEEETCFHLFDAASAETVERALSKAGVESERISEAFDASASRGGEE